MIAEKTALEFEALGGTVTIQAGGAGAGLAVSNAENVVREIQDRLTRFESDSELSRLNSNPETRVGASPIMLKFAEAVGYAGRLSGGLVDATLLGEIESAGYRGHIDPERHDRPAYPSETSPAERQPGGADPQANWRTVYADRETGEVVRRPGVRLDSGGLGKGLAADIAAECLEHLDHYAVECSGDLRFGSSDNAERLIRVSSPFAGEGPVAEVLLRDCAVATSGITRRSWLDDSGKHSHHLIDPLSGKPAYTGVLQATAIAPTALEAEVLAKAALLSGRESAAEWLVHGGVLVLEGGRVVEVESGSRKPTDGI